ncbi:MULTISPECIES: VOC family protein [Cryobacterium]|uniref:Glyoxalase n=1 Tax=Cryobacterium zongtaii TaxID=1259217 RepID=A0A2S3ZEE7_9MICO|nr:MULTISPECIES: VOC family protein [Cryobacterium]ASD21266.1 glyoxalase [Cryobacterium sp. LW097]MEC5184311.1 catechol 2,3-dioxygenase-like lactoylglutathione lyase family enzyme [Cryobacterium sp. MP_3.1]POH64860.1 glyoxalase [Cryobacterium zongtaii]POH65192.1 glyoxalase [Cryobacterium zongtaii]POH66816.1 glyoxalase [Cryobacterium zongtaii]
MLSQLETVAVLPARDIKRARSFYTDKLGLEPTDVREGEMRFRTPSGGSVLVYETENAGTAKNTALIWMADDVDAEVARLREAGVVFEEYDLPGLKTENGIATTDQERAAWFKDSEGNILCVAQEV